MPQPVKFSNSNVPNSIKKGEAAIGVNNVEYGPTPITDWWSGIDPPVSGYTAYAKKAANGPSIMVAQNDNDLLGIARAFGASSSVTTTAGALNYFASQSDMIVVNKNYNNIVTSGLVLNLDASFVASYPVSGTSWYDVSGSGNTGTLQNGPTFNSDGYLTNDGVNDNILVTANSSIKFNQNSNFTMEILIKMPSVNTYQNDTNNAYPWLSTDSNLFNRGDTNGRYGMDLYTNSIDSTLGCYDSLIDNISGDLWVVGYFQTYNTTNTYNIAKINTDGSLDTSFVGTNGLIRTIAQDSSGKIYIGGDFSTYSGVSVSRIAKLNNDGTLDTSFTIGSGFNASVFEIKIDSSNNLYVGGNFTTYSGATRNRMIKLTSGGTIDSTFSIGTGFNGIVRIIEIDNNNKILVGGDFTTYTGSTNNYFIRLNTDGSKDTTLNIGNGFGNAVYTITKDSTNKYYLGGTFTTFTGTSYNRMISLNDNGTVNTNFGIGTGFNSTVESIVVDNSNNLYVGGWFSTYSGNSNVGIIKLLNSGVKDVTFTGTGLYNIGNTGVSDSGNTNRFNSLKIDSNGKIYGVGKFNRYISTVYRKVIKLNTNGSVDTSFNPGNGIRALMNFGSNGGYYLNLRYGCRGTGNTGGVYVGNTLITQLDRWYYFVATQQTGSTYNTGSTFQNGVAGGSNGLIPNSANTDSNSAYYMARSNGGTIIGGNGAGTITNQSVQIARLYNRVLTTSEILQNYYGAPITTSGLIMSFDGGNLVSYPVTGASIYDLSVSAYSGTLVNGPTYSVSGGGSLLYDGSNDYVTLPSSLSSLSGTSGASLSMWIKLDSGSNTSGQAGLIQLSSYNNSNGNLYFFTDASRVGGIWLDIFRTDRVFTGDWQPTFNGTNWHNLTVTCQSGSNGWKMYLNQNLAFQTTGPSVVSVDVSLFGGFRLGQNSTSRQLKGRIAICNIYNRVLSTNEVVQNFNAYRNRFGL
jgi:uncharacterized delta-60 repeat protein